MRKAHAGVARGNLNVAIESDFFLLISSFAVTGGIQRADGSLIAIGDDRSHVVFFFLLPDDG